MERLHAARIHPIAVLAALKTYAQGKGERGKSTWTPVPQVVDALDAAFYATFQNVEPTGKRWLLALSTKILWWNMNIRRLDRTRSNACSKAL